MSTAGSMPKSPRSRNRILAAAIVVIVLIVAIVGFFIYEIYNPCNFFPGCGPVDEPQILAAKVVTSSGTQICAVLPESFEGITCEVTISGGTSGVITMNMTSLGGDSQVQLANYSSSPYVKFTLTAPCPLSPTGDWNYGAPSCTVSGNGSTFRFGYSVALDLTTSEQAILTVTVLKTCCWP